MNTSQYFLIITELKKLRGTREFDRHEKLVERQMAKFQVGARF